MEIKVKGKDPEKVARLVKRLLEQNPDFGPDQSIGREGECSTVTIAERIVLKGNGK